MTLKVSGGQSQRMASGGVPLAYSTGPAKGRRKDAARSLDVARLRRGLPLKKHETFTDLLGNYGLYGCKR